MPVRFRVKKDRYLIYFFIFLAFVLITLFACLLFLRHIITLQMEGADEKYESLVLAQLVRQSSDDLTKMARLYVMTDEKKYKEYYFEILDIRNGKSPRPEQYHHIYWDLVQGDQRPRSYGKTIPLKQLMIKHGFTLEEFELLQQAQNRSDDLVQIEERAMYAVEGKFDDGTGKYLIQGKPNRDLAIQLVFGEQYRQMKAEIMAPLQKFFEGVEERTHKRKMQLENETNEVIILAIILSGLSTILMGISIYRSLQSLSQSLNESNLLLLNILPQPIAERLKHGEELIADEYPQASILFADIVGFTVMTAQLGASRMVDILNRLFDEFDDVTEKFGVEKVKTIGDNYMAVAGVPIPTPDHAIRLADFALAMREIIERFNKANALSLELRVGMNYGKVVAGVIGHKKFIYDIWGDTVNVASRMETTGIPGEIQVTEKMAFMLSENFNVEEGEEIEVKGKGTMKTFFLKSRK